MNKKFMVCALIAASVSLTACRSVEVIRNGPMTTYSTTSLMGHAMVSTMRDGGKSGGEKVVAASHSEGPGSIVLKGTLNVAANVAGAAVLGHANIAAAKAIQGTSIVVQNHNGGAGGSGYAGSVSSATNHAAAGVVVDANP